MWNDNETTSDLIDYQHLVSAVSQIINNEELLPCTIGIFGDWGSGKSSLMKMVEETYTGEKDSLVIKFNGWLFEGYEDAKSVLMGRIVDEIIKERTLTEKAFKLAVKLLNKIDLLKVSGTVLKYGLGFATLGPAGVAAITAHDFLSKLKDEDYEKYIKDKKEGGDADTTLRTNIQEFHKNFEELLGETKIKRLLVFIDDLDRCSPDTIIGTLEAIKLFLFTKDTAFIIGADERLIKYAVRRRFPEIPGDATEVGRDYLEKLIQHPIRIPPLNSTELETYVNLLFAKLYLKEKFEGVRKKVLSEKNSKGFTFTFNSGNAVEIIQDKVGDDLNEALMLCSQITPVLAVGLNGNPRQAKRFLNTLLIRYAMSKSKNIDLNKRILAKMMLLEYFRPETFKSFYESQAQNDGVIKEIEYLEEIVKNTDKEKKTSKKETGGKDSLSSETAVYLQDSWLRNWFKGDPSLSGVNLQPYYYFSRDRLSITSVHLQRMSALAQELFGKLMSESDSIKTTALTDSKSLSPGDASAIFEALTDKIRQDEKQVGEKSNLRRLIDFCNERPELISQLMIFLEKLPEKVLPVSIVTLIEDLTANTPSSSVATKLILKWSTSTTNLALSKVCKTKLKPKSE